MNHLLGINWKIRFNKQNTTFILRFLAAALIFPITYLGLQFEDLTTWEAVWDVIKQFFSNPFLIAVTIANTLNMVPDGTTKGWQDSIRAKHYVKPGGE